MKTKIKIALLAAVLLGIQGCIRIDPPLRRTADTATQSSFEWAGTYRGVLPCLTCTGVETELVLRGNGSQPSYVLTETRQSDGGESIVSKGRAEWDSSGSRLTLLDTQDERIIFLGDGYVAFVQDLESVPDFDSLYRLDKVQ